MTLLQMHSTVIAIVDEAVVSGIRRASACTVIGFDARTLRRWRPANGKGMLVDQRPLIDRSVPQHKLTVAESDEVVRVCQLREYGSLPPSKIVPKLADKRQYIASESTFFRILRDEGLLQSPGRAHKADKPLEQPRHNASRPNEVCTYGVTFLPSRVHGQFFYLYIIQDFCSRYGVHWEVHYEEHADHNNAKLIQQAVLKAGCSARTPILHSDNGSTMNPCTMRKKLTELRVTPSFSRPSVSNDNVFIESMLRTVRYSRQWPLGGFATLEDARVWVPKFMDWYNEKHQHSGINYVTPAQRYGGENAAILGQRGEVYTTARARNPRRWSGKN